MSINTNKTTETPLLTDISSDVYSDDEIDINIALQMSLEVNTVNTVIKSIIDTNSLDRTTCNKKKKESNKKCYKCSSNVPVYRRSIKCKCGHLFCPSHSKSEDHSCSFDYTSQYREILAKQNNKCIADKCNQI